MVGALLDAEAEDSFINNLILSVRSLIPVEALVEEVEKRNKLKMLNPFLEQLVSEGSKVGGWAGRWRGGAAQAQPQTATPEHLWVVWVRGVRSWAGAAPWAGAASPGNVALRFLACSAAQRALLALPPQDPQVHNALGKIIIDTNNNPEHFLTTNPYYDSLVGAELSGLSGARPARRPGSSHVAWPRLHAVRPG